jgi:chromate transporter
MRRAGQAGLIDRIDGGGAAHTKPRRGHVGRTLLLWLPLWLAPVAVLVFLLGPDHVFSKISLFFSQMAVVTFGGAYAVLAWWRRCRAMAGCGPARCWTGWRWRRRRRALILVLGSSASQRLSCAGALAPWFAGLIASLLTRGDFALLCGSPRLWNACPMPCSQRAGRHHRHVVGVILNLALCSRCIALFGSAAEVGVFSTHPSSPASTGWRGADHRRAGWDLRFRPILQRQQPPR